DASQCPRLARHALGDTVDRSDALDTIKRYICDLSDGREKNGFVATVAAPGCGKSHILDEGLCVVSQFTHGQKHYRVLPLAVSFNGLSEFAMGDDPDQALISRLLY